MAQLLTLGAIIKQSKLFTLQTSRNCHPPGRLFSNRGSSLQMYQRLLFITLYYKLTNATQTLCRLKIQ